MKLINRPHTPKKGLLFKVEVQSGAHSNKLSDKERICELVTHNVKPDCLDKYLKTTENIIGQLIN